MFWYKPAQHGRQLSEYLGYLYARDRGYEGQVREGILRNGPVADILLRSVPLSLSSSYRKQTQNIQNQNQVFWFDCSLEPGDTNSSAGLVVASVKQLWFATIV
jgi:hypothetical protein